MWLWALSFFPLSHSSCFCWWPGPLGIQTWNCSPACHWATSCNSDAWICSFIVIFAGGWNYLRSSRATGCSSYISHRIRWFQSGLSRSIMVDRYTKYCWHVAIKLLQTVNVISSTAVNMVDFFGNFHHPWPLWLVYQVSIGITACVGTECLNIKWEK